MKASHEAVVAAITQSLAQSEEKTGKPTVDMKISYSKMEQLVRQVSLGTSAVSCSHSTGKV